MRWHGGALTGTDLRALATDYALEVSALKTSCAVFQEQHRMCSQIEVAEPRLDINASLASQESASEPVHSNFGMMLAHRRSVLSSLLRLILIGCLFAVAASAPRS